MVGHTAAVGVQARDGDPGNDMPYVASVVTHGSAVVVCFLSTVFASAVALVTGLDGVERESEEPVGATGNVLMTTEKVYGSTDIIGEPESECGVVTGLTSS